MHLANVDANIKLKKTELTTIASAILLVAELKDLLEKSESVYKANIFLDLNDDVIKEDLNDDVTKDELNDGVIKDELEESIIKDF